MLSKFFVIASILASTAIATPLPSNDETSNHLSKRSGQIMTGQWQQESDDNDYYTISNNMWGTNGHDGSAKSQVVSWGGDTLSWWTSYSWGGSQYQVKAFTNIALNYGLGKQLSAITYLRSVWNWSYTKPSSNLVANVAYDFWLSNVANGKAADPTTSTYEVMVWLSVRGGANPLGTKIATVTINHMPFALWAGSEQGWKTFSFVAAQEQMNWDHNMQPFFTYLVQSQGVPASQYLVSAQAGTEEFIGSTTLTTSAFSMIIDS